MAEVNIEAIVKTIANECNGLLEHNDTVNQIERVFRRYGFYTTREYRIFRIQNGSGRAGRIDLVARKGKFRVAVEYDHHEVIKWKSFQKIVQIKPDVAIGIVGKGGMRPNIERAQKYIEALKSPLYVVSLKDRLLKKIMPKG